MNKYEVGDIVRIVLLQRGINNDLRVSREKYVGQTAIITQVKNIFGTRCTHYMVNIGLKNSLWVEDWFESVDFPCNCALDITLL